MPSYDVVIIGAGPAGLSASLYTSRARLKTLVIGQPHKSLLENAHILGNYIGLLSNAPGSVILDGFVRHAQQAGAEILQEEVVHVEKKGEGFVVKTHTNMTYDAKAVIIAAGAKYMKSGIPNESKFVGKGIHYCVACDGIFYKNKKVAVLGNGNYAAEEALELTQFTKEVTVVSSTAFDISPQLEAELKKHNVKLLRQKLTSFNGDKKLDWIATDTGEKVKYDGVFVAVGTASSSAFANKLGIDNMDGFLTVDRNGRTNVDRVYAAGGCTGGNVQVAKSVGEGCNAAVSCVKDLLKKSEYFDYS